MSKKKEIIFLVILFLLSAFLRFQGLGYSDYYGDETKTLYLDKTVPAYRFFMDQRKGPLQFMTVWFMEKLTIGYSEVFVRFPFAFAGLLTVFVFYVLVKKLFGWQTAAISSLLFSVSGFNVAFSRTAQYQSLLVFFGILAIYLFLEALRTRQSWLYALSAVSLSLSFWAHYDAIFFLIPIAYLLILNFIKKEIELKRIIIDFVLPFLVLTSLFYVPYIIQGYFNTNVVGYLERRFSGSSYLENNSFYTFMVYNPTIVFGIVLLFGIQRLFQKFEWRFNMLLSWFLGALIPLEIIVSNPGTHIHNYFIPIYIVSGYGIYNIYISLRKSYRRVFLFIICITLMFLSAVSLFVYAPAYNKGYPWKPSKFLGTTFNPPLKDKYHLYLYGFPYNRGWRQISEFIKSEKGVNGVYTNDNDTIAEYYLLGFNYTIPGSNFIPHYYIHVFNNQQFTREDEEFYLSFIGEYKEVKKIFVDNELSAIVFKKKETYQPLD